MSLSLLLAVSIGGSMGLIFPIHDGTPTPPPSYTTLHLYAFC